MSGDNVLEINIIREDKIKNIVRTWTNLGQYSKKSFNKVLIKTSFQMKLKQEKG